MSIPNDVLPSRDVLEKLAQDIRTAKTDIASAQQSIGTALKNAEKHHNVHKKAIQLIITLAGQSDEKQQDFMLHFDHYADVFNLRAQGDLIGARDPELTDEEKAALVTA